MLPALAVGFGWEVRVGAAPPEPAPGQATTEAAPPTDHAGVDIEWDAPLECPDLSSVKHYAERLLGQPLDTPRAQRVVARAKVHRNAAGNWMLRLSLTSNERVAEETLVAKQCSALGDATALKVALATDPVAAARAIEAAGAPPVDTPVVVASPPPRPSAPVAHPAARGSGGLRLNGGFGFGLLPGVARGGALALWLERSDWRAELAGAAFWGDDARYEAMPTIGAHLQLFSGSVRGCHIARAGAVEFPVCLGLELGLMRGTGFGLESSDTSKSPWGGVVLGPGLRIPLSEAVSFWFEGDGIFAFLRSGFNVRNLGTLYTSAPAAARLWAGCEIRLSE